MPSFISWICAVKMNLNWHERVYQQWKSPESPGLRLSNLWNSFRDLTSTILLMCAVCTLETSSQTSWENFFYPVMCVSYMQWIFYYFPLSRQDRWNAMEKWNCLVILLHHMQKSAGTCRDAEQGEGRMRKRLFLKLYFSKDLSTFYFILFYFSLKKIWYMSTTFASEKGCAHPLILN